MELVLYERAKTALAAAHKVDEVKEIRDRAEAAAAYARQARDSQMIQWATEIKVRAERRAGEMLRDMAQRGERGGRGRPSEEMSRPATLTDMGITRDQSSRWQQLADMPDEHFETAVETAKHVSGEVSAAFVLRQHKEGADDVVVARSRATGPKTKAAKDRLAALDAAVQQSYTAGVLRTCIRVVRENRDDALAEIELVMELRSLLAEVVSLASARQEQAA